jgi:hypothetical protein
MHVIIIWFSGHARLAWLVFPLVTAAPLFEVSPEAGGICCEEAAA